VTEIVIDTSALMEILLDGSETDRCTATLSSGAALFISAGTLTEALAVSLHRGARTALETLLSDLQPTIIDVGPAQAQAAADAYGRWGKGFHGAGLNFGDCFAYALAKSTSEPLLFKGNGFRYTDVAVAGK
jgi:ribonuclease VapC